MLSYFLNMSEINEIFSTVSNDNAGNILFKTLSERLGCCSTIELIISKFSLVFGLYISTNITIESSGISFLFSMIFLTISNLSIPISLCATSMILEINSEERLF